MGILNYFSSRVPESPPRIPSDKVNGIHSAGSRTCPFCSVSKENGFDVVWEDEKFIVFRDYKPAAEHHMQVIPKHHVESIKVLGRSDVEMVRTMRDIGIRMLDSHEVPLEMRRLGFHIPPYNSVDHLHLHVQALPYKKGRVLKYPVITGGGRHAKGFSWFVEVEQALKIIGEGRRVSVLSC